MSERGGPACPLAGGQRMKSKSIENQRRFWRKSPPSFADSAESAFAANMTIVNIRKGQRHQRASLTSRVRPKFLMFSYSICPSNKKDPRQWSSSLIESHRPDLNPGSQRYLSLNRHHLDHSATEFPLMVNHN